MIKACRWICKTWVTKPVARVSQIGKSAVAQVDDLETDFACLSVEWTLIITVDWLSAWEVNKGNCITVSHLEMWLLSVS